MIKASDLATVGCKYLGTPYTTMDCQAFVEKCLKDLGLKKNLPGSNAWYREVMRHGWIGKPEECKKKYGSIPPGAFLFIWENDGGEKEHGYYDGLGNASHIGIFTNLSGDEMVEIAKKSGNKIAGKYNFGNGAINSSSTHESVCTSKFYGKSINGGWNRVGLWDQVDYQNKGDGGETMPHTMIVSTPDGGSLNMRTKPSTSGDIITRIPNGTPVNVIGETDGWKQIDYAGKTGWVMESYLVEPSSDPQGQICVPRDELERIYDTIGDWLGLRG